MSAIFGRVPAFDPIALEWSRTDGTVPGSRAGAAGIEASRAARPAPIGYRGGPLPLLPGAAPRPVAPGVAWVEALKTWLAAMPADLPPRD